jgi:hypothetical protein
MLFSFLALTAFCLAGVALGVALVINPVPSPPTTHHVHCDRIDRAVAEYPVAGEVLSFKESRGHSVQVYSASRRGTK